MRALVRELSRQPKERAMDQHQTAITAAFVMNGLHKADLGKVSEAHVGDGDQLQLIDDVMEWVPAIEALRAAADSLQLGYPGVFEYEVTAEFGHWLGDSIVEDGDLPNRAHAMGILIDLVESFFRLNGEGDRDMARRLRAKLDAAADIIMAPQAANDGA
jgi:hypothetical protein